VVYVPDDRGPHDPGLGQLDATRVIGDATISIDAAVRARLEFRNQALRARQEQMRANNPQLPEPGELL
jgi:hypothetical protein